jgi:hypothetical protein
MTHRSITASRRSTASQFAIFILQFSFCNSLFKSRISARDRASLDPFPSPPPLARLRKCFLAVALAAAILAPAACVTGPGGNTNSAGANSNSGSTSADSNGSTNPREPIYAKEPDQYSETISITVEPTGQDKKVAVPPLQFDFARLGSDRRAAFQLPGLGQVIYLEHSGLKYIVLPARNQYLELDQATLGVELPRLSLMTPTAVVEHLKSSAKYYKLGAEDVNGRPAIKYRFTGKLDTQGGAGLDTDSTVYLDETTGLPVRAEIVGSTPGGAGARVTLQMSNVQLVPDRAAFDVPIGFRKVTAAELRQQINSLAATMRIVALTLTQQATPAPTPSTTPASSSVSPTPAPRRSSTPRR